MLNNLNNNIERKIFKIKKYCLQYSDIKVHIQGQKFVAMKYYRNYLKYYRKL